VHGSPSSQRRGAPPQSPATQRSPVVHAKPSLQVVPSGRGWSWQAPVAGWHTARWQALAGSWHVTMVAASTTQSPA